MIKRSKGFEKKRLGEYTLPIVYNCGMGCLYCYVPSQYARVQAGIGSGEMVYCCAKPAEFYDRLLEEIAGIPRRGAGKTIVISPSTEPFAMEALSHTQIAIGCLLVHSKFTVRVITKKPLQLQMFLESRPLIRRRYWDRLVVNISMGIFSSATLIEPGADIVEVRMACLRDFLRRGMRCALMMCPVLPRQEIDPFLQYGSKLIGAAEEVFCEPLNPRGRSLEVVGEYIPAALEMRDSQFRSARNYELIKVAHDYVPAEKLRVLIYGSSLGPNYNLDSLCKHFPGTLLLGGE